METQMNKKALHNDQKHLKVVKSAGKTNQRTQRQPKGPPKGAHMVQKDPQRVPTWSKGVPKALQKPPKGDPKRFPNQCKIQTHLWDPNFTRMSQKHTPVQCLELPKKPVLAREREARLKEESLPNRYQYLGEYLRNTWGKPRGYLRNT